MNGLPFGLAACFLLGVAPAQSVFVVDANNGPGTHFTDLAVAAAAAPDGSVLRVRPGLYATNVTIQAKSLAILAEPGARLGSGGIAQIVDLAVAGLGANQRVTLHGLAIEAAFWGRTRILLAQCAGELIVESVLPSAGNQGGAMLEADSCANLQLRDCGFSKARFTNCLATLSACTMPHPVGSFFEGTVQTGGRLALVDCQLAGASVGAAANAVTMNGGDLRVLGNSTLIGAGGFSGGHAIGGTGTARLEPTVGVVTFGVPHFAATVTVATATMARVTCSSTPMGGSVQASLLGPGGHFGFLLASHAAPATVVPWLADPLWLDPASAIVQQAGTTGPTTPIQSATTIPPGSALLGFALHWQGLTAHATLGWQCSNVAVYVVH